MLNRDDLYTINNKCLMYLETEEDEFDNLLNLFRLDLDKNNVVVLLRGSKMKTIKDLFDEFASALQFPSYFGENWNALDECINDLSWLPGDNYIIGINDIKDVLISDSEGNLEALFKVLNNACDEWRNPKALDEEWGREAKPFHVIMQYRKQDSEIVRDRFNKHGF